ncbi:MAG: PEP-CTERM sorting domain-containing protein, partial [Patescibacteria group bacterium]|nr:PEP-CTERM sorting domain-containing protein [Patescibacteria group bacterium]
TNIMFSDQHMWISTGRSTLRLGADNTFKTDLFTLGGNRANARLEFASGGTLTLGGSTGSRTDLRIGYQTLGTGSTANSTADFSGGTLNATLDELIIGYAQGKSTGGGTANGTMLFGTGTVTANSVTIGDANASVGQGIGNGTLAMSGGTFSVGGDITLATGTTLSKGTINLSGGMLSAGSITKGTGTASFNFTGGTLHVGTFGSEARPFDLVQNGGTLAPGNSPGMTTIYGNYTMAAAGALEIEISGLDQGDRGLVGGANDGLGYDFVMVHGDATLAGSLNVLLLDDFYPVLGTHFDVLQTTGTLDITGLTLNDQFAPMTFGWWEMAMIPGLGGEGAILRLSAVPEPSSALLLVLVLLAGCVRRRRR